MHLLYLQQFLILPESPGNSRSWEFAHQWWETGWDISIVTTSAYLKDHPDYPHPQNFPYKWSYKGIDIYVLDIGYSHLMPFRRRIQAFVSFYRKAWKAIRQVSEVDAVLAYTAPLSVADLGRNASKHLEVPFFLEIGDVWPDVPVDMGVITQRPLINWLNRRTQKIYDQALHIFPFSPGMKEQVMAKGVSDQKITPIPNGARIAPKSRPITFAHPKGMVRLLYTGTVGMANDLSQLMEAMAILEATKDLDIYLDVVGEGNDKKKVVMKAKELGLQRVSFHEKVSKLKLKRFWESADIGIVCFKNAPTLQANGSAKFFDYLAAGIPVVINYEGWQAELLREYNCGMSSEQGNVKAFAWNLIFLAKNPPIRLRMGGNGRRLVSVQFDRQLLAKQMQDRITQSMKLERK